MLTVECSVVDWEQLPNLAPLYRLSFTIEATFSLFTARRKEIGKLWHCSKERARNTCLLCEINFLKYCFIVELFKKWRICPPQDGASIWRLILTFWRTNLVTPHVGGAGGGVAWVALSRAFPQTQGISFLPRSPYLHDILLMFLMLYSPLDTAILLVLLQPSGDGYFLLCSSKSSFCGTMTK